MTMIRDRLQAGIEGISIKKQRFVGKRKRKGECCIFHGETFLGYAMIMFQPFISRERFFLFPFFPFYSRLCNSPGGNSRTGALHTATLKLSVP
jgi:hypothetical protein